jgi:hypothetical protein
MGNVPNCDSYITIQSSQTYRSYNFLNVVHNAIWMSVMYNTVQLKFFMCEEPWINHTRICIPNSSNLQLYLVLKAVQIATLTADYISGSGS